MGLNTTRPSPFIFAPYLLPSSTPVEVINSNRRRTTSPSAPMAALSALHPAFYTLSSRQYSASVLPHSFSFRTRHHPYSSSAILPIIKHHLLPLPSLSRRLFLTSVSGFWDSLAGSNDLRDAVLAIRRGMQLFRQGDVSGSLDEFDRAVELDPRQKAYLWQRGLTLYYLDRFEESAEQFRLDVAQNPNDTEESIWCFLSEAQLYGIDEARRRFLEVGRDSRPVMREAYEMFKDGGDPEKLVAAFSSGHERDYFYASLYAGLYYESQNNAERAQLRMLAACQSPYGQRSDDYMASLAKVHCLRRNWKPS